tara:strand:+ start:160 stop:333 length:174 start_codon:yes stop_codon:yes gene_type:complete
MIVSVVLRYVQTGDPMPAGHIEIKGATITDVNQKLQALADWLPDHIEIFIIGERAAQ